MYPLLQGMEKAIVVLDQDPDVIQAEGSGDREAIKKASMGSVGRQLADAAAARAKGQAADPFFAFALVIDGKALTYALDDALRAQFLALSQKCDSVSWAVSDLLAL